MTTHPLQFGKVRRPVSTQHSFGSSFPQHQASTGDKKHDQLVAKTEKWVAQTFYGQMLKQMRNSPFKSKMFSGGRGGEAFGEMFDQQLADRMSKGIGQKLVNKIVKNLEAPMHPKNGQETPQESHSVTMKPAAPKFPVQLKKTPRGKYYIPPGGSFRGIA